MLTKKSKELLQKLQGGGMPYIDVTPKQVSLDRKYDLSSLKANTQKLPNLGMMQGAKQSASPEMDWMSLIGPAGNIATGLVSFFKGRKQEREAKALKKIYDTDVKRRMDEARASGYYATPYTAGRSDDLVMQPGGNVKKPRPEDKFTTGASQFDHTTRDPYSPLRSDTTYPRGIEWSGRGMLSKGSRGDEVVELQSFLQGKGMYTGKIDGIFGPKTEAAVKKYQEWFNKNAKHDVAYLEDYVSYPSKLVGTKNKIAVDGIVGDATRAALMYREMPPVKKSTKKQEELTDYSKVGKQSITWNAEDQIANAGPVGMNYPVGAALLAAALLPAAASELTAAYGSAALESSMGNALRNVVSRIPSSPGIPKGGLPTTPNAGPMNIPRGVTGSPRSFQPRTPSSYGTRVQYEEGGIPERYKNMGFNRVGQSKESTRDGKKWMVLAKKGDKYKVVHGGYDGMEDYTQHGSEKRRDNFWNRMGGKNSANAKDPFSPLYWHKRLGKWQEGGTVQDFLDSYFTNKNAQDQYMQSIQEGYNERVMRDMEAAKNAQREGLASSIGGAMNVAKMVLTGGMPIPMQQGGSVSVKMSRLLRKRETEGLNYSDRNTLESLKRQVRSQNTTAVPNTQSQYSAKSKSKDRFREKQYGGTVHENIDNEFNRIYTGIRNKYKFLNGGILQDGGDTEDIYSENFVSPVQEEVNAPEAIMNVQNEDMLNNNALMEWLFQSTPEQPTDNSTSDEFDANFSKGKGTIAVTHNNPGNIKFGEFAKRFGAKPGKPAKDGGVFAVFPDAEVGLQAQRELLKSSGYIDLTVDQAMRRWSNNGYGGEILPEISNKRISELSDEELRALQAEQIRREDVNMYKKLFNNGN